MSDLLTSRGATISPCGLYRYTLTRKWGDGPTCTFVMLNPSTADAMEDDPTIRRCIGFALREGCGGLKVVNLFAFRATKPEDMMMAADPHGPRNAEYLHAALRGDGPIAIAGWGAHPLAKEAGKVLARRYSLNCLGLTKEGAPRHPLYIKRDAPLVPFSSGAPA